MTPKFGATAALRALAACVIASALGSVVLAQDGQDVAKRLSTLESTVNDLRRQLDDVAALLRASNEPQAPRPIETVRNIHVDVGQVHLLGRHDAAITMIEFADFQCPFCGQYAAETYPTIRRDFIDRGAVRYGFHHFPLERIHPEAIASARVAECAGRQDKFWEMHDSLFAKQAFLGPAIYTSLTRELGLDNATFASCVTVDMNDAFRQAREDGTRNGVVSTPTFLIGRMDDTGSIKIGVRIVGGQSAAVFSGVLAQVLAHPDGL